jgi:hypothetical protein
MKGICILKIITGDAETAFSESLLIHGHLCRQKAPGWCCEYPGRTALRHPDFWGDHDLGIGAAVAGDVAGKLVDVGYDQGLVLKDTGQHTPFGYANCWQARGPW